MLSDSGLPHKYWSYALEAAIFVSNRGPHPRLKGKTAFEVFFGKKPDVSHLRAFGSTAYVLVPKAIRKKLDDHTVKGIFLGYSGEYNYKVLIDRDRFPKIVVSCDVTFINEAYSTQLAYSTVEPRIYEVEPLQEYELQLRVPVYEQGSAVRPAPAPLPRFQHADDVEVAPAPLPAVGPLVEVIDDEEEPLDHRCKEAVEVIESDDDEDPAEPDPPPDDGHEYRPYRIGRNPGRLENVNQGNILPVRIRAQRRQATLMIVSTRKIYRRAPELIALVSARHPALPTTFKEAMALPAAAFWLKAIKKELDSIRWHKVFKSSRLPAGARALGYRWVFTRKEDAKGNIIGYKARLVVQGFAQRLGINYNKTFAPVSLITTILFLIANSAALGLVLEQFDYDSAFFDRKD